MEHKIAMRIPDNAILATTEEFMRVMRKTTEPLKTYTETNDVLGCCKTVYRMQSGAFLASEEVKPCGFGIKVEFHIARLS